MTEIKSFLRAAEKAGMSKDDIIELIDYLGKNPEAGDEMEGAGGCRKLRFAIRGNNKGKSGGVRTITLYSGEELPVLLIAVFAKSVTVSLSKAERNALNKMTGKIVDEYSRRVLPPPLPPVEKEHEQNGIRSDREGMQEALAVARGEAEPYKLRVPAEIDVKAIRNKMGLSQKDFAQTFGFGFDQLKQWEQGRSRPVQAIRAYLLLINAKPIEMVKALRELLAAEPEMQKAS
ncbi:MAG: type II toxin-antitoxin system RelE/ParE family toxin [Candidatus Devosia euplotis]|nr:type II toxin-antitoxin system RelE/ParE family toxin [Candidatus Devosia euplotis]